MARVAQLQGRQERNFTGLNTKPKGILTFVSAVIVFLAKILGVILLWQGFTLIVHSIFIPTPIQVWTTFWRLTLKGDVQGYTLPFEAWTSLMRVLRGFALAIIVGIPVGILFGLSNRTYQWTKFLVEPIRFIPPLAWVPLVIIFLHGESRYTFIIWIGAVFPIIYTTMSGVKVLDNNLWEVGRVLGASKWQLVTKIAIPAALPHMFSGARLGLGIGWACIVAAEMVGGGNGGLGSLILNYGQLLQIDAVVASMIVIGMLGYALNEIFVIAEKKLFPWQKDVKF
ncbi:MAG: ABC transporter permease [Peptococcaceae bacterium]|nr:ABC transporter permease [Peptococcaceae bacterium]